jgi:hypothetical protein
MQKRIAVLMFISLVPIFAINAPAADELSPVVVSPLTAAATPVTGTDGKFHIVYELVLTNANATPATLQKVEVLDASDPAKVLAWYEGQELQTHVRKPNGVPVADAAFSLAGRIPVADFEKAVGVEGDWRRGILASPESKKTAYPLNLDMAREVGR